MKFDVKSETVKATDDDAADIVSHILSTIKTKLEKLQDRITSQQIECTYIVMELSLEEDDKTSLDFIKMLKPDEIDWGTIPDYMSN